MSDYQLYPGMSEPAAFIASPMLDGAGKVVGVVAFQLDNKQIFQVFTDYTGLGETGETLVGVRKGDEVTFVAPLRHDRSAAFRRKIPMGGRLSANLQAAVQGQRGYGVALDYRGKKVAAVHTYLPSFRWGMVVKQDADEAFDPIYHQRLAIGGLLVAILLPVVWVARMVARSISRPVRDAAQVAERVASGDLTARVETQRDGRDRPAAPGDRDDDRVPPLADRPDPEVERLADVHRHRDRRHVEAAGADGQRLRGLDPPGRRRRQGDLGDEPGAAEDHGRGERGGRADRRDGLAKGRRAWPAWTGPCASSPSRPARSASKLSVISERAGNINLVVTTITKVADQTNLLSINAAIEAEKAGEYGLGFLVVAREIRRLADQTAVATLDIERMVKEMQYSVSAGVMEMDKFSDQVRQGVGEVGHIGEQLGQIISAVQA